MLLYVYVYVYIHMYIQERMHLHIIQLAGPPGIGRAPSSPPPAAKRPRETPILVASGPLMCNLSLG